MAIGDHLLHRRHGLSSGVLDVAYGFEENLLEGVAAVGQTTDVEILASHQAPDGVELDTGRKNDAPPALAFRDSFGAVLAKGSGEVPVVARNLQLDKPAIGAPLLFQISVVDDAAVLEDDHFVAYLFDIAQKMG